MNRHPPVLAVVEGFLNGYDFCAGSRSRYHPEHLTTRRHHRVHPLVVDLSLDKADDLGHASCRAHLGVRSLRALCRASPHDEGADNHHNRNHLALAVIDQGVRCVVGVDHADRLAELAPDSVSQTQDFWESQLLDVLDLRR